MNSLSTGVQNFEHISKDCRPSNAAAQNCTMKYLLPQIISDTIIISGVLTSNGPKDQNPELLGSVLSFITGHDEAIALRPTGTRAV